MELPRDADMTRGAVMKHLKILLRSRRIGSERSGRQRIYHVTLRSVEQLRDHFVDPAAGVGRDDPDNE